MNTKASADRSVSDKECACLVLDQETAGMCRNPYAQRLDIQDAMLISKREVRHARGGGAVVLFFCP